MVSLLLVNDLLLSLKKSLKNDINLPSIRTPIGIFTLLKDDIGGGLIAIWKLIFAGVGLTLLFFDEFNFI